MELGIREAWEQARSVFDHGTLELSREELLQAWRQARPFVKLVSREFLRALGDTVLLQRELTHQVELQLKSSAGPMAIRYPRSTPKIGTRPRLRFDAFEVELPMAKGGLRLRFRLGEGDKSEDTWSMVEWGLGTWGAKKRVESEAMPVLQEIQKRVPDLELDSWQGIVPPLGTWAQVGRMMHYTEFGEDIEKSVKMIASDFSRLLDAAQRYQEA